MSATSTKAKTTAELIPELGAEYRQMMIREMANIWGGRATNAVKPDKNQELALWMQPTSPAAEKALAAGGTAQEVETANAMWAAHMKSQGATDEEVFRVCRKFAYQLGKSEAKADLAKEFAYHEQMAQRAAAYRLSMNAATAINTEGMV